MNIGIIKGDGYPTMYYTSNKPIPEFAEWLKEETIKTFGTEFEFDGEWGEQSNMDFPLYYTWAFTELRVSKRQFIIVLHQSTVVETNEEE